MTLSNATKNQKDWFSTFVQNYVSPIWSLIFSSPKFITLCISEESLYSPARITSLCKFCSELSLPWWGVTHTLECKFWERPSANRLIPLSWRTFWTSRLNQRIPLRITTIGYQQSSSRMSSLWRCSTRVGNSTCSTLRDRQPRSSLPPRWSSLSSTSP